MPVRRKKFILALQPHEAISPIKRKSSWSSICVTLLLLMGLAFPMMNPGEWGMKVQAGLSKVALGTLSCPYMQPSDAIMLLKEWYGAAKVCSEATEGMWNSYCQQFYMSEGGDCGAVSAEMKATIMGNMRVCRKI